MGKLTGDGRISAGSLQVQTLSPYKLDRREPVELRELVERCLDISVKGN